MEHYNALGVILNSLLNIEPIYKYKWSCLNKIQLKSDFNMYCYINQKQIWFFKGYSFDIGVKTGKTSDKYSQVYH